MRERGAALHASWTMTGTDAAPIALQVRGTVIRVRSIAQKSKHPIHSVSIDTTSTDMRDLQSRHSAWKPYLRRIRNVSM